MYVASKEFDHWSFLFPQPVFGRGTNRLGIISTCLYCNLKIRKQKQKQKKTKQILYLCKPAKNATPFFFFFFFFILPVVPSNFRCIHSENQTYDFRIWMNQFKCHLQKTVKCDRLRNVWFSAVHYNEWLRFSTFRTSIQNRAELVKVIPSYHEQCFKTWPSAI